jgi:outer membrane biosynthesis protein TonB
MHGVEAADIVMGVKAEGRLSIALGASIALHVVAFVVLVSVMRFSPSAYPFGQDGNIVLQAMLTAQSGTQPAEPEPMAAVEPLSAPTTPVAPTKPIPAPVEQAPAPAGNAGSSSQPSPIAAAGAPDPPVMITTRALSDLGKLPPSYAEVLAQRFTDPVQKSPELRVPLLVLYPREALDERKDARITVALAITENGEISEKTIIPDDPVFAPAIVEALKEARFNPAEIDGRAVAYWAIIEFVFTVGQRTPPKGLN